jgi:hypothetical protein
MQAALEGLWHGTYKYLNQAALAEDELVPSVMLHAEASRRVRGYQRRYKMVCDRHQ